MTEIKEWLHKMGKNLGLSLTIHILLLTLLLLSVSTTFNPNSAPANPGEIVQATVVDEKSVDDEVQRIQQEEKQKKDLAEEQQKQMVQKLEQIKKEQEQEKTKLEQMKQDMAKAKQEEQDQLADIKLAKEKEQKRQAAIEEERQAELKREKQIQLAREKEEKRKQLEAKKQADAKKKALEAKKQAALKAAQDAKQSLAENQRIQTEVERVLSGWAEKIRSNKREAIGMSSDLICKLSITVLPDGNVQVRLLQSSGNSVYDDLSIKAVYKSQPFPLPEDPKVREEVKTFDVGLKNEEGVG